MRYAPHSHFAAHTHGAGEQILVLDGVFSDETGDFPAGWYVRNPPGSRHTPASAGGAVIFVKLRQMPPQDEVSLRLDARDPANWRRPAEGCEQALLYDAPWERVVMLRIAGGYAGESRYWRGGAEFFVVEGGLLIDGAPLHSGSWLRLPAGSRSKLASGAGALVYRKTGHLGGG